MRPNPTVDAAQDHLCALFDQEADRIHGYLMVRTGSRAVAEDLAAEVFVAAARRCAQGHIEEVTGAWLQTVARRRLVDHWRRTSTRRRLTDRLGRERPPDAIAPGTDDHGIDTDRVDAALDSLPDRQRAALCLRYLDGFSVAEVAESLHTSYQGTESLLARARRSFATAYEDLP